MEKTTFSRSFFDDLRQSLPRGAMSKIAEKLTTPQKPVSARDVYTVLKGKKLAYEKCDPNLIILEALEISKAARATFETVKRLQEELTNTDN